MITILYAKKEKPQLREAEKIKRKRLPFLHSNQAEIFFDITRSAA
jgi:hypothetical protein